ncbi:hypothetical protein F442_20348 [Phytophthora nicotianae P10297]|uniref:Uncharacterized protein n=5 Tax=Phytophthora nicotianae TaxID=4792 RepID=W2QW46_PHYN3|nr:hypothetical protein PPTG_21761 [Phytophthora nicotianae INRA-310]ETI32705.1 hypothetical protein F443_20536 [Phytophthora nicotianae P1569]ETL79728.1 hypothetical protein L917_19696 [Phytophthora nicotianae]ETO61444.1 hypothetical protein F444_20542 [Phytophthora nicotianae P1976]ETP30706.1 hypothetical protein F442_20348 [Phytophthora nicotianae P10297]ETM32964.1 hypothetical protein L914_19739 [Phytophthora nicotianae]
MSGTTTPAPGTPGRQPATGNRNECWAVNGYPSVRKCSPNKQNWSEISRLA